MLVRGSFDEQRNMRFVSSGCNTSRSPHSSASISKFVHACMPSHFSHIRLIVTLWAVACQAPWPWDSSNKNTGVGCHALLQGIFPTQGLNPHFLNLLHWQVGSLSLGSPGKPHMSCCCCICPTYPTKLESSLNTRKMLVFSNFLSVL